MFYEVIYENGDSSVMSVDSEEEALEGIRAQHERATKGQRSLQSDPNSPPAVRIKRVLAYDKHPNEYHPDSVVPASEARESIKALETDGSINVNQLVSTLRGLTDPLVNNPSPHESRFHMKESSELDEKAWAA